MLQLYHVRRTVCYHCWEPYNTNNPEDHPNNTTHQQHTTANQHNNNSTISCSVHSNNNTDLSAGQRSRNSP